MVTVLPFLVEFVLLQDRVEALFTWPMLMADMNVASSSTDERSWSFCSPVESCDFIMHWDCIVGAAWIYNSCVCSVYRSYWFGLPFESKDSYIFIVTVAVFPTLVFPELVFAWNVCMWERRSFRAKNDLSGLRGTTGYERTEALWIFIEWCHPCT